MKQKTIQYLFVICLLVFSSLAANAQNLKLEILNGHSGGGVLSVAVSSDGKYALTGSTDQTALLWDLETGKQLRRFVGHQAAVNAVAFSKDGRFVLTASADKTARLWETATGKPVVLTANRNGIFAGHTGAILSAAISADGFFIATASEDKTARIWDLRSGKQLFELEHAGRVNSIAFSPDSRLLLTGGEDKIARLYDVKTGAFVRQFVGHTGEITSVAFSPKGIEILTGSNDETVRLWSLEKINEVKIFETKSSILSVTFTPNRSDPTEYDIAAGKSTIRQRDTYNDDKLVYYWNKKRNWALEFLPSDKNVSTAYVAISANESFMLIATGQSEVLVFNEKKGNFFSLEGKSSLVTSVSVSPDYHFIANGSVGIVQYESSQDVFRRSQLSVSNSKTSNLLNLEKGSPVEWWRNITEQKFDVVSNRIKNFKFQQASYKLTSYLNSNEEKTLITNRAELRITVNKEVFESVSFSQTGNLLAITRATVTEVWDYITGKLLSTINTDAEVDFNKLDSIYYANSQGIFSPDSKYLLLKNETTASLWGVDSRKKIREFIGHELEITSFTFSKDGKIIATTSDDKTVRLWNAETGEVKQIIKDFLAPVWSVAFSPDGKTIAAASGGEVNMSKVGIGNAASANGVRLFDVETGKEKESFGGEFKIFSNRIAGFKSVAYSKDGKYIAAGSFDGKVYLRDNETKTLRKFEGHTDAVNSVKFAEDAKGNLLVVSGSSDSTTRIWNAATGEEICALVTFRDGNWAVVQTRTGRYDAPNGGEIDGINWVFGNETIALSQLKDIYYTPNLLPRLLGYNKEPLAEVRPLANIKLFPEIIERNFDKATGQLTVKLQNRGGGIGAVRVMVNEKLASEDARNAELIEKLKANPNLAEAVVELNLKGSAGFNPTGANRIEVFTNDFDTKQQKSFVSSNPKNSSRGTEIINLGGGDDDKPISRKLYAIVGGVSDYNGTQLDLNFAAKDSEDFANALGIAARGLFCDTPNCTDKVQIKLLTTNSTDANNLPTKRNFRAAFADIAKQANPEDILVVYLAGHGTSLSVGDADTYFFLTQEAETGTKDAVRSNPERAISNRELLDWLTQEEWTAGQKGIKARNQVLILDTCAAGAFEAALTKEKPRDLSADQIKALEKLKDRTGLQILMGSAANQSAYEASQYGQGLLTYALLEGIKGAALKNQTSVETGTLFDYAVNRVPKMDISNGTSGLQSPRVFGATSIPIGLMQSKAEKDAIVILESPLPVFGKPFVFNKDENFDTIGLINSLAKKLDEAGDLTARGSGGSKKSPSLVYVDDDNFPGAYRVTGTYTAQENGAITIEAVLRKDGKVIASLDKISGKDANDAAEKLFEAILKRMTEK